ncbi:unnamed protein product [Musa acuminata subsp. malaccensis]|uniref:(wild Malaysian banana) hypothetical protein n=1 Tax=Musa acuminata subsp. malaccensis TaxID=214687 RepID=A0A804JL81_MUSAM|nr:PREDICTED: subtilisin-like protease SBT5.6 [Musa acuminata subsp. malaccensis]CAG1847605.1 unnamed protein product [Musa acuminata subsp. malaccensis]
MRGPSPYLVLPVFFLIFCFTASCSEQRRVYIVYLGQHNGLRTGQEILEDHHSLLRSVKNSEEEALNSLVYSYKHSINGFAALLTEEEAAKLSAMEEVVSAFPGEARWSPHTTRSWEFIIQEEGLRGWEMEWMTSKAKLGKEVIVGVVDSGVWPESQSFSDAGMGPIPERWKGICQEGDAFESLNCNK